MADPAIERIFRIERPVEHSFSIVKQNIEATEDFAVKKVINVREGTIEKVPVNTNDIVNKAYADGLGGFPEGTQVKSTGEAGGTKFLREDGDGTSSWQTVPNQHVQGTDQGVDTGGANEVTAAHIKDAYTHSQDNTQAHTDYLLNSGADEAVGPLTITADNSSADTAYVPMVLYNTDATPPAANTVPIGTIYVQYTA